MSSNVPSYHGLRPASPAASRAKQGNKRRDTEHELLLRRTLWHMGLRFRKNVENLIGKPDLVFTGPKIAVFCDGDFWHGRNWPSLEAKLEQGTNPGYWAAKIKSNMERDARNTALLEEQGWLVIRLWETNIKKDPVSAATLVKNAVDEQQKHKRIERELQQVSKTPPRQPGGR